MEDIEHNAKRVSVLVVEDEALIACDLQNILESNGYRVIGPAASLGRAWDLIEQETPDLALLDVNLGSSTSFPLADVLTSRNCKIVFVTGHSRPFICESHRHRPVVEKPFLPHDLLAIVQSRLDTPAEAA